MKSRQQEQVYHLFFEAMEVFIEAWIEEAQRLKQVETEYCNKLLYLELDVRFAAERTEWDMN